MEKQYRFITSFVQVLDNQFKIFGIRFGVSGLIGFIPGLGDIIDALLSLYLILFAIKIRMPFWRILQMIWNILVNLAIGAIPIIGDATYIIRRVNMKNLKIINQYVPPTFLEPKK
jgi:hypothetical protein